MNEYQELCKQVYERLGWEYGGVIRDNSTESMYGAHNVLGYEYSADYLLQKLASASQQYNLVLYYSIASLEWNARFKGYGSGVFADTPTLALLKLTLALCDAGELKPTTGKEQQDGLSS